MNNDLFELFSSLMHVQGAQAVGWDGLDESAAVELIIGSEDQPVSLPVTLSDEGLKQLAAAVQKLISEKERVAPTMQ